MPKLSDFKPGDAATLEKAFSDEDVRDFARVSLDANPIHLDEAYARAQPLGERVVHGILQAGLISAVLGTKLPGPGGIYREQTLVFKKPARIGEKLTARVEVLEVVERMGMLRLKTTIVNAAGELLVTGEARGLVEKG